MQVEISRYTVIGWITWLSFHIKNRYPCIQNNLLLMSPFAQLLNDLFAAATTGRHLFLPLSFVSPREIEPSHIFPDHLIVSDITLFPNQFYLFHSLSFMSVFRPGTFLICRALARITSKLSYRMLNTGFQYSQVLSIATFVMPKSVNTPSFATSLRSSH